MDRIRLAIWTFILLLFSVTIWGDEIYFRSLGVKDGLSQPSSIAIWQDRLGRIWLGNNAVNCYDGISTKVIRLSEYFPSLEDVCESCGASYHIVNIPPKKEGICDVCGGALKQRKDDDPETVKDRLAVYHKETEPLKGFYEARGVLKTVEDQPTVEGTTREILRVLGVAE